MRAVTDAPSCCAPGTRTMRPSASFRNDTAISTPVAPFGGTKEAGLGREGGSEGIDEYLDTHAVRLGIGSGTR